MCVTLSIATLIMCAMLIFLIVIKAMNFQFQSEVLLEATVIGFAIAIGVIFLIVVYFFISEILIKSTAKIEVIIRKEEIKKQLRHNCPIYI
jgi:VIT1/CCC1 family predicted Fe2+/Mn2+ transporter